MKENAQAQVDRQIHHLLAMADARSADQRAGGARTDYLPRCEGRARGGVLDASEASKAEISGAGGPTAGQRSWRIAGLGG